MAEVPLLSAAEKQEAFARQIRASGWLYMVAFKKLDGEFGVSGRTTIRHWMRTWGVWRGQQARKGHQALGLDINMINLMKHWDSAAATTDDLLDAWDNNAEWHPNCIRIVTEFTPYNCPQAKLWRDNEFWMGAHVHCDEFHVKYTQGYHPEAICVLPECIMKKEDACHFTFMLPPNAKEAPAVPLYEGENPLADWKADTPSAVQETSLRRKARITAGRVVFLWMAIKKQHPECAERLFGEIMNEWFRERGNDIKRYIDDHGLEAKISAEMFKYYDHPYWLSWDAEISEDDEAVKVSLGYCPFAETWEWVDKEDLPVLQRYYCQQCYKTIFPNAFPGCRAELTACRLLGDQQCEIVLKK